MVIEGRGGQGRKRKKIVHLSDNWQQSGIPLTYIRSNVIPSLFYFIFLVDRVKQGCDLTVTDFTCYRKCFLMFGEKSYEI